MSRVLGDIVERALTGEVTKTASVTGEMLLEKSLAREGVSGLYRPTDSWFSALHTKVNSALGEAGDVGPSLRERFNIGPTSGAPGAGLATPAPKLDIYGAYKGVDNGLIASEAARERLLGTLRPILKGVGDEELAAYGEMLPHPEEHWGKVAEQFGLSGTDTAKVRALKDWDTQFQQETGNSFVEGMSKLQQARVGALSGDTIWDPMINNGHLPPMRTNVAEVIQQGLNKGLMDKYLADPLKVYEDVMNTKGATGQRLLDPVRQVMQNYAHFVEGVPDQSRRTMERMAQLVSDKITDISPKVSHFLGLDTGGRSVLQKATTMAAAMGLGARPALIARDVFDWHRPMVVMGADFFRGAAKAMTPEGWAAANGVLMKGKNISELMGNLGMGAAMFSRDTFNDVPAKVAEALLAPTRWGNNFGRAAAYLGEFDNALAKVSAFRSGALDTEGLINGTGLAFHDPAPRSKLLQMAMDHAIPATQVADAFGRQMVDSTLFAMRYGSQGALLRTGAGRVLGQFGQWPMNYWEYLKRLSRMTLENPTKGLPTFAAWAAVNTAMQQAGKGVGVDLNNWVGFAPAAYTGSPYKELIENVLAAPDEGQRGLDARKKISQFALSGFMPGGLLLRNLYRSATSNEFSTDAGYMRALGFRPLDKEQNLSLGEWLRKEAGYGTGRQR